MNIIPDSTVRYSFAAEPVRSLLHDRLCSKKKSSARQNCQDIFSSRSNINCFNKYIANIRVAVVGL